MADDSSSKLRLLRSRPLCIMCARPSEAEHIAKSLQCFRDRLSGQQIAEINDDHVFYLGAFKTDGKTMEYYITSSLRQGIQAFATHASILFHVLRPQYAIHAGVCAGYREEDTSQPGTADQKSIRLEHVILGERAINYEEGKWEVRDGKHIFRPDYAITECLTGDLQSWASHPGRPLYHYGDFISGSAVRGDAMEIFQRIRMQVDRNAIGLDMEASVFFKLCQHLGIRSLGVIKGVSDFGDGNKGRDSRVYESSLQRTAEALEQWVAHRQPNLPIKINEGDQPGAQLALGYYNNFVKVVLDALCHSWHPAKYTNPDGAMIEAKDIKGLKIVMPDDNRANFFAEPRHIFTLTSDYGVRDVKVGGLAMSRNLHYKAGYLIDFPRTINSLVDNRDSSYQVECFFKSLAARPYLASGGAAGEAQANNVPWKEFMQWLSKEAEVEKRIAQEKAGRSISDSAASGPKPGAEKVSTVWEWFGT